MAKVDVVVDLQWGSTAKGKVAHYLTTVKNYSASIRVQSIQAGHTIYYKGKAYKMRTIPCAWVNPNVILILGAGIFIEKELLLREIAMLEEAGVEVKNRLYIDYRANYITEADIEAEATAGLTKKMGSTGEGAGSSLIRKIWRKDKPTRVIDDAWAHENKLQVCDTIMLMDKLNTVLVEGCQGTMLSVHTSPQYPYVTSREATVSGILSECGISPFDVENIHGVFRTYPIRVGGNSGPTASKELTWDEVAKRSRNKDLVPEKTTVTNRNRRIFEFSYSEMRHAMVINRPNHLYLTFVDYINSADYGKTRFDNLTKESKDWVYNCEKGLGQHINWASTGEKTEHFVTNV